MNIPQTIISRGISITVRTVFRTDVSDASNQSYFYNYEILIQNSNAFSVQLMHRNWYIFDSLNEVNFVSGEGVVGEKPILHPGESFKYVSGCEMFSDIGYMTGTYDFMNLETGEMFRAEIPKFHLIFPGRLN